MDRLLEVTFEGWEFTEGDLAMLREEFATLAPVRVNGGHQPAVIPAATIELALTFVGQTLAAVIAERILEKAWGEVAAAMRGYRSRRQALGLHSPELAYVVLKPEGFDIEITGVIDPEDPLVLEVVRLIAERRETGKLKGESIRSVALPCKQDSEGRWSSVYVEDYADPERVDYTVWRIGLQLPGIGPEYYDARRDQWIQD